MYLELFKDEKKEDEFEIEEIVPENEGDLQSMLRQLKSEGIISQLVWSIGNIRPCVI